MLVENYFQLLFTRALKNFYKVGDRFSLHK